MTKDVLRLTGRFGPTFLVAEEIVAVETAWAPTVQPDEPGPAKWEKSWVTLRGDHGLLFSAAETPEEIIGLLKQCRVG